MNERKNRPAAPPRADDRRSGINRRWIRAPYHGVDRRSGSDRRTGLPPRDIILPELSEPRKRRGFEKLLISSTLQLEAITRLLLEKGLVSEAELYEMMQQVQTDYQNQGDD